MMTWNLPPSSPPPPPPHTNTHTHTLTHTGEPFTQEEMEEMLTAAIDPDKGVILYRDFVATMIDDQS